LRWINGGDVQGYMALHRNDPDAKERDGLGSLDRGISDNLA